MDWQLWAYATGSNTAVILPQPLAWNFGAVLSDVSAMQLTYPTTAVGVDVLNGAHCDVEVRYWNGTDWICPPQGRFCLSDKSVNVVAEQSQPTRTYTLQSWSYLLRMILQEKTTGLDDNGNRPFANQSVGQVIGTLISEAQGKDAVPDLVYLNSAGTGGSPPAYPVGMAAYDILSEARDEGLCEWLMLPDPSGQGRKLVVYSTVGTDRTTGDNPVTVRYSSLGDVVDAPSTISNKDVAPRTLIAADGGKYKAMSNPDGFAPHGQTVSFVTASGLTADGALTIVGDAQLAATGRPLAQHTRQIDFNGPFLPFQDYSLGDTILAPDQTGALIAMKVQQITITMQQQGGVAVYGGTLVLGDRFSNWVEQLQRKVARITGAANAIAGTGKTPTTFADDPRKPAAPTAFNVGSTPYTDPDGHYKALALFGWVNPTTATDGSDMDPGSVQVYGRKGTSGTFGRVTSADFPATSVQWSPFDAGAVYQFKLRAVSSNGKLGPFGSTVQVAMARDTTPPPVPSTPTLAARGGTVEIRWDGTGSAGEVMPADFDHTEVHVSASAGFTPSKSTLIATIGAPGVAVQPNLPYNTTRYVKLISVDRAGNKSAASAQASVVVKAIVDTDLIGAIVDGANIKLHSTSITDIAIANSVTTRELAALSVKTGNLDVNSVTFDRMAGGALDGFLITGGIFQTSASFPKIQLNDNSLSYWTDSSHALFQISVSSNRVLLRSDTGTATGFAIDTNSGISLYNSGGARTLFLNAATGGITMTGPLITSGTMTGAVIQTSASGARVYMNASGINMVDGAGNYLTQITTSGYFLMRSSATGSRIYMASDYGLASFDSSGNRNVYISNDGSATFAGPIISGGTITGATFQTATSGARVVINSGGFNMVNSSGDFLTQITSTGYFLLRSSVSGARIYMASNYGLAIFNNAGTRTVYLGSDGSASFSGTVTASNINTTTINGATFTGTQSGGTFSGMTQSGGTWTGSIGASGVTATGGVFRTSSASTRIELNGPNQAIRFYLTGTLVATLTAGGNGVTVGGVGNLNVNGNFFCDHIYNSSSGDSANVVVGVTGLLYRGTSSKRYKADIKPLAVDKTILKLPAITYRPRKDTSKLSPLLGAERIAKIEAYRTQQQSRRYIGHLAEDADALGLTELVTYDAKGRPDAYAYDREVVLLNSIVGEHDSHLEAHDSRFASLEAELAALTEKYTALTGASS